jgi:hypothetical protein
LYHVVPRTDLTEEAKALGQNKGQKSCQALEQAEKDKN